MEFSVRSFAVVSLLLLVSLSTDMSGPIVVGARIRRCDVDLCNQYCSLQDLPGCCSFFNDQCVCGEICPQITEEVMIGAKDKEPFIKEVVIA